MFAIIGDILPVIIMWRGLKMIMKPHEKMLETAGDFKTRKITGGVVIGIGILAIIGNHIFF